MSPFILISPASRGLSLALTRHYLRTTNLPVYATHRNLSDDKTYKNILTGLSDVDSSRLRLLRLELTSEASIAEAASTLKGILPSEGSYVQTAFFAGGILHPERKPSDLNADHILDTFKVNVISHLLCIKHFSQFLPKQSQTSELSKWVHISARVGSVSDNRLGGWYSYRASKAALNQVIRTFDLHLQTKKTPASDKLFEPESAAEKLANVVKNLRTEQRGRIWDWAGKEIVP